MTQTAVTPFPTKDRFIGAIPQSGGTRFRLWAPIARNAALVVGGRELQFPLEPEGNGYFSGTLPAVRVGDRYKFTLDGGEPFPDPASRYQPEGPHGPSEVIDPAAYAWSGTEAKWPGVSIDGQVLYELHVGTFSPEGTFLRRVHSGKASLHDA
jgi:maltooligosyltrehalose trehalohydrolase